MAIEQALTVLSWYENLQTEERPPEYLWEDPEGLEQWFNSVEAKRESGADIRRGHQDSYEDDGSASQTENDLARFLKE